MNRTRVGVIAGLVVMALLWADADPPEPSARATTTTTQPDPVWLRQPDGGWLCTPTLSPECNCALPPMGLDPGGVTVVNEPWVCGQIDNAKPWEPILLEDD